MKKLYSIIFALVLSANTFAQEPYCQWANAPSGTSEDKGNSVTTDASGNVYVTGQFVSPTITFGTTTLANAGSNGDMFIVKYNAAGTVLWAKRAGGTGPDEGSSISTDASGNIYVTGYFISPTITFGTTTLSNVGYMDIFIAKYDAAGNVLWAKSAGDNGDDWGLSVSTDASGNVYVTGYTNSATITFGTTILPSAGGNGDIFIAKYDAAGTVLWAKRAGGTDNDGGTSVTTDASGNVYVTGRFASPNITFGTTTLTNDAGVSSGYFDIFIAKYDAAGAVLWAKSAGGTNIDFCYGVTTDAIGNVYVTGYFESATLNFGTTTITNAGNVGYADMFIAKYDAAGTVLWAKRAGGTDDDLGYSVSTDASGDVYVMGSFYSSTITFGTTILTNANAGGADIFIAKYDAAGTLLWAKLAGGTSGDEGSSIATDASGNVYVTGYFVSPTITFGSTTLNNTGNVGYADMFIAKYSNLPFVNLGSDTTQCGGTVTLDAGNSGSSYLWSTGATTQTIIVSVSGNYIATVTNASGNSSDTVAVTIDALPTASTISANGNTTFCAGDSVILSGNVFGTWSTGASTSSITVLSGGTYSVTNTNSCGSTTSNSISVTVNPLPTASNISAGGATTLCAGDSVILSGNVGGTWSTGASTSSITVLNAGTYSVTNTNSCGSTTSNAITVIVNPSSSFITQPTNQLAIIGSNTQFVVQASNANTNFQWQQNSGTGFQNLSSFGQYYGVNNDTLSISNLNMSQNNYGFRCIITNFGICGDTSLTAILTLTNTVGIINFENKDIQIIPNPTSSTITLTIPKLINCNISITNHTGKQVGSYNIQNSTTKTIDVSYLAEGVYFVTLKSNEGVLTKKIVKTN
jgi:hypothetical protein